MAVGGAKYWAYNVAAIAGAAALTTIVTGFGIIPFEQTPLMFNIISIIVSPGCAQRDHAYRMFLTTSRVPRK